jgi:hypothetical protein
VPLKIIKNKITSISKLYSKEEFEDTKEVIRIRKSKKNRQHNGQKRKGQTTIYKTYT